MAARTACAILARSSPPCRCLSTEAADVFLYANGYDLEISEEDSRRSLLLPHKANCRRLRLPRVYANSRDRASSPC